MTRPGNEPRSPGTLADILTIMPICVYKFMLYLFIILENVLTVTGIVFIFTFNMINYIE